MAIVHIMLTQGVISEPLGMGSFGVVWAARCDGKSKVRIRRRVQIKGVGS